MATWAGSNPSPAYPKVARLQPSGRRGELLSPGGKPFPEPTSEPRTTRSSPCTAPAAPDLVAAVASTAGSPAETAGLWAGRAVALPSAGGRGGLQPPQEEGSGAQRRSLALERSELVKLLCPETFPAAACIERSFQEAAPTHTPRLLKTQTPALLQHELEHQPLMRSFRKWAAEIRQKKQDLHRINVQAQEAPAAPLRARRPGHPAANGF